MLIPSIDLLGGRIVQLVQGEKLRLAFDDFEYWIERFSRFPLVQLIDLDAAMRQGENSALVEQIAKRLPVQAGGGIHTIERARQVLEAGAQRVIIGSALFSAEGTVNTDFAAELAESVGAERVVAGIDTKNGRIAVKGWKAQVELTPDEAIPQLEPYVAAFLYTHVDGEGMMQGFPIETGRAAAQADEAATHRGRRHSQPAGGGCAGCAWARTRWWGWRCIQIYCSLKLPVQAGGGIHTVKRARQVLEAGAQRVIIGSALFSAEGTVNTEFAAKLAESVGAERVVAGIDTKNGRIAVKGWKAQVELTADDAIPQLEPYAAAFLYTHVDTEGTMRGFPADVATRLRKLTKKQLIVAGGIRSQQEVDALDSLGADAVVGMAVYTELLKV